MFWFVSDIRTPNSAVSICLYISNIKYISSDLQLGKLKEDFLATLLAKTWLAKKSSFNLPSCKSLDI